jgi:hypothetical protein
MNRLASRGGVGARRRRVPLMVSFGVLSLVLTLALGSALAIRIEHSVTGRGLESVKRSTRSAIALTTAVRRTDAGTVRALP